MADPASDPIFQLDTTRVEHIRIDDVDYPLADVSRMTVTEQVRLKRMSKRAAELFDSDDELNDQQLEELEKLIESQFASVAPSVPDEVSAKLGDWNKMRVVNAFFRAEHGRLSGEDGSEGSESGAEQSPGSSASMEDPRATG